jgi:hypothetical protein
MSTLSPIPYHRSVNRFRSWLTHGLVLAAPFGATARSHPPGKLLPPRSTDFWPWSIVLQETVFSHQTTTPL